MGSQFKGRFYLKTDTYNPSGVPDRSDDKIWYEFTGVLTACAVQFTTSSVVEITADFITTGPIEIRMEVEPVNKVLQEDANDILLDQDAAAKLLLETDQ